MDKHIVVITCTLFLILSTTLLLLYTLGPQTLGHGFRTRDADCSSEVISEMVKKGFDYIDTHEHSIDLQLEVMDLLDYSKTGELNCQSRGVRSGKTIKQIIDRIAALDS